MIAQEKRNWLIAALAFVLTFIAVTPVIFQWSAPKPSLSVGHLFLAIAYIVTLAICWLVARFEADQLGRSQANGLGVLLFLETIFAIYCHRHLVDLLPNWELPTNTEWQIRTQDLVVHLSPEMLPHSYRFLPNALVYWLQIFHCNFVAARDCYQLLSGVLLFYALYRFARLHASPRGAILAMTLAGLVYPISFVGYAGQLTDPLSHLSFILAFIFLETAEFPLLLATLIIGSLAKETFLAMCGFYVLFQRRESGYFVKAVTLCAASLAFYYGVRLFVLHGSMHYRQVSNVSLDHVLINLHSVDWGKHFLLTGIAYLPFLLLGWKTTPTSLKSLVFYLLPVLLISSLFFSWLNEARNYMPLVIVLAVVAARFFDAPPSPHESPTQALTP